MSFLRVDKEKCTKCGACADVCPGLLIRVDEEGPQETGFSECVACGHCVAVCPVEALDNVHAPLSGQVSLGDYVSPDPHAATLFLRSRRSTRSYKKEQVPRESLLQICDIARFASTGGNSQGLSYLIISDKKQLKQLSRTTFEWMEKEVAKGADWGQYFPGAVRGARETGKDVVLRDAPHLIVALCDKGFLRGPNNAHFSLAYAELFAPTLGVGTCWAGFFLLAAFSGYAPLSDVLNLPQNKTVAGALIAGFPRHKYRRLVDRNPLDVVWR